MVLIVSHPKMILHFKTIVLILKLFDRHNLLGQQLNKLDIYFAIIHITVRHIDTIFDRLLFKPIPITTITITYYSL